MIHIAPKFGIFDLINTIFLKFENWRIQQRASVECFVMDSHTMHDIGFHGPVGFKEATKRTRDK